MTIIHHLLCQERLKLKVIFCIHFIFYKLKDNFKRFESVKEIFSLTLTARQKKASF